MIWVLHLHLFLLFITGAYESQVAASDQLIINNINQVIDDHNECSLMEQPYRTGYHFQPPNNWMNDPNGPVYYKGVYHLFYQYNPYSPLFGNISWAHSVSSDLINWVHLERVLDPTEDFDILGCWSGSITILPGGEPVILYTGFDINNHEVQNLAVPKNSSDPLLREWVKSKHNPLMIPVDEIEQRNFRDPTTAWLGPDGIWRVIIGGIGNAVLYRSEDFITWNRSNEPLHSSSGDNGMWECPDFFPVSVVGKNGVEIKHVLKASLDSSHDDYIMGSYEPLTDKFEAETDFMDSRFQLRYDYGKFYASKTFFDSAKARRVLWGWVKDGDGDVGAMEKGWAGLQAIPRTVFVAKSGNRLVQWPVEEIEKLRSNQVKIRDKELKGGSIFEIEGVTAFRADMEAYFQFGNLEEAELLDEQDSVEARVLCSSRKPRSIGPFGLMVLATEGLEEHTSIFFQVFRKCAKYVVLMCSDQSRSSLRENVEKDTYGTFVDVDLLQEELSLRILVDGSIIESFGGEGMACITARVYPILAIGKNAHIFAFNNGTRDVTISRMNAWSMKPAHFRNHTYSSKHNVDQL